MGIISVTSVKEIKEVVFSLAPFKSDPQDSIGFLISFTEVIGVIKSDLCAYIQDIFNNGLISHKINSMSIDLISKCDSPESIRNFRPIINMCKAV